MNGKRIGALVLAVALVAGAFFIRRDVIDDDDNPTTDDTSVGVEGDDEPEGDAATALYCITELADACRTLEALHDELDITIEDAGETLDRLATLDDDEPAPLWITIDPYPAMVDLLRGAQPLQFDTDAVGSSRLAIAFPSGGKADAIANACATASQTLWRCLGDLAGADWSTVDGSSFQGTVRPSFGNVTDSALALTSFGNAVADYFGDVDPDRTGFEDVGFITWFARVRRASDSTALSGGTPLGTMANRPSALDVPATATFEVTSLSRPDRQFDVNYADPEMWVQAVIATPAGVAAPSALARDATTALAAEGWDPAAAAEAPVPSASTLLALRTLWDEAT